MWQFRTITLEENIFNIHMKTLSEFCLYKKDIKVNTVHFIIMDKLINYRGL